VFIFGAFGQIAKIKPLPKIGAIQYLVNIRSKLQNHVIDRFTKLIFRKKVPATFVATKGGPQTRI
jgi:hypothetical protein